MIFLVVICLNVCDGNGRLNLLLGVGVGSLYVKEDGRCFGSMFGVSVKVCLVCKLDIGSCRVIGCGY